MNEIGAMNMPLDNLCNNCSFREFDNWYVQWNMPYFSFVDHRNILSDQKPKLVSFFDCFTSCVKKLHPGKTSNFWPYHLSLNLTYKKLKPLQYGNSLLQRIPGFK